MNRCRSTSFNSVFFFCHEANSTTERLFTECTVCSVVFVLQKYKHIWFLLLHEKIQMQTDQDEEHSQGDGQNETEEKTTQENEEIEVRSLIFLFVVAQEG